MHRSYLYPHNPTFGALSQGRARFFCIKAGFHCFFSTSYAGHASCAAIRPVRAAPFPALIIWCTRTAQAVRPYRTMGFSLNLSWSAPPMAAGTCRALRRGQEGRHQGFYPLNSHFLLGESGAACRYVTASKKEYGRGFFLPQGSTVCSPVETYSQGRLPYCYTCGFISAGRDITVSRKS